MITQLNISNFAIIEHLEMGFTPGLNIISGETGAGKSIIINAVNLILGKRASNELIRSGCKEATVEALFYLPDGSAPSNILKELGIPFDSELLIKRTISREGKNRIYINGTMATLQMLNRLGMALISISGQHEHQLLLRPENHLSLLDDFAGLRERQKEFARELHDLRRLDASIEQMEYQLKEAKEKGEVAEFQLAEIERANLKEGEDNLLAEEKSRLSNASFLRETLSRCYYQLYESEKSVFTTVARCAKEMEKAAGMDKRLEGPKEAIEEIGWKAEDVAMTLRDLESSIRIDPERLREVNERIELINSLKRKYGNTIEEIIKFKDTLKSGITGLDEKRAELDNLKNKRAELLEGLLKMAYELSVERKRYAKLFKRKLEQEFKFLNMEHARFEVNFTDKLDSKQERSEREILTSLTREGIDSVEFMITSNPGEEPKPLAKVASGGELSRIVLAMKTILAKNSSVDTIIFDEVDAGISGETAAAVGEKLFSLSSYNQLICITHLPQIASKGRTHFHVEKDIVDGRTRTTIRLLEGEDRVYEIARLLGGRKITRHALKNAKSLLNLI